MIPIRPQKVPQLFEQAQRLFSAGKLDQAESLFRQIALSAPKLAEAPFQLARIAVQRGDLNAARDHLDKALALKPGEAMIWRALADLCRMTGDRAEGAALLTRARGAKLPRDLYAEVRALLEGKDAGLPAARDALVARATAQRDRGELAQALQTISRAIAENGNDLAALALKADILHRDGQYQGAATTYRKMLKLRPQDRHAMTGLALVLSAEPGQEKAARAAFDAAIKAHPQDNKALFHKAQFLQDGGSFSEAEALLRKIIKRDPGYGEAFLALARGRKVAPGDPLIGQMTSALSDPGISAARRAPIGFAMAKAMEDTGAHERVFEYLNPANAQYSALGAPYDDSEGAAMFDGLKEAFGGVDFSKKIKGTGDFAPIFVTGLPRSGTTLVERLLSNHPGLTAIGEAAHLMHAQQEVLARRGGGFHDVAAMPDAEVARFGEIYTRAVKKHHGTGRVIDKAMMTLHVAGLVRLALPQARIILVRRDPRDIGLSMYKNVFPPGSYRYSYDLTHLGRFIRMYEDMAAFWREQVPGLLIEVQYEELVADPHGEMRRLTDQLGLSWSDDLTDVQKSAAKVRTLSVYQARQPIYKSSARAWEKYKEDLAPLIDALGDLVG